MLNLPGALKQEDSFSSTPEAVTAMKTLAGAYPEMGTQPVTVVAPTAGAPGALRTALGDGVYVGGPSAEQLDMSDTSAGDRAVVVPLVIAVVLIVLMVLLRSLVAPLILVAAVVAVRVAALGIGGLVFEGVFGFEGTDPGLALLSFVFLVALGVDYGIFLMHRMREETGHLAYESGLVTPGTSAA